jgi:hypothetical protein
MKVSQTKFMKTDLRLHHDVETHTVLILANRDTHK